MIKSAGVLLVSTVLLVSAAFAQMAPARTGDTPKGKALVDPKGMTLYVFDKDKSTPGKSACNGPCAENWPALLASDTDKPSGDWTIAVRDDGKKMWAYKGRPLYTWKNNKAPGDTDGDGKLNGAWHIAAP
jgi:predicted lipoprotein with Yx(FWY)xxD motif